jgi:hypothetical protein
MATRRPDLESAEFKAPPYIGEIVCPHWIVGGKAGTVYYQDIQSDVTGQTARTNATAPTARLLAESSTTWSAAEVIERVNMAQASIELLGGLANAELVAARKAKRGIVFHLEKAVAAAVLANGSATVDNIENDLIGTVATGKASIMDQGAFGPVAFVCSKRIFDRVRMYTEITNKMLWTPGMPGDPRRVNEDVLANILGVDRVLVGPDDAWYTASATYQERAALVVLPDPNATPLDEIQFARQMVFPVGEQGGLFMCESYYDDNLKAHTVDAQAWANLVAFNNELVYILSGLDVLNASSTTTTTSTTTGA